MKKNQNETTVNTILTAAALFLAAIIIISTAVVFLSGKTAPGKKTHIGDAERFPPATDRITATDNSAAFTGLGRIRTTTAASAENGFPTSIIISPWFSYKADDTAFFEELSRKNGLLKEIVQNYFTRHTEKELRRKGEERIKAELCAELNENLSLSKIESLYFSEYIFLD